MKSKLVKYVLGAALVLGLAVCLMPAELEQSPSERTPTVALEMSYGPPDMKLVSDDPQIPRYLVFYPPGKAPSEALEFDPVPFEELLPGPESPKDDDYIAVTIPDTE